MIVRPLDKNGDIMPIYSQSQMIGGKEAVAQIIDLRLHFFYGEWWEDRDIGFRVPRMLVENARKGDVELMSKYIASYVAETEGVRSVVNVVSTFLDHKMKFQCAVVTEEGRATSVEVDVSGIL